jgi:hypothetical protein
MYKTTYKKSRDFRPGPRSLLGLFQTNHLGFGDPKVLVLLAQARKRRRPYLPHPDASSHRVRGTSEFSGHFLHRHHSLVHDHSSTPSLAGSIEKRVPVHLQETTGHFPLPSQVGDEVVYRRDCQFRYCFMLDDNTPKNSARRPKALLVTCRYGLPPRPRSSDGYFRLAPLLAPYWSLIAPQPYWATGRRCPSLPLALAGCYRKDSAARHP